MLKKYFIILLLFNYIVKAQDQRKESHTFYAIGNTDYIGTDKSALSALRNILVTGGKNSTVLFLGNSASSQGFSNTSQKGSVNLTLQTTMFHGFPGNIFFIPGAADWQNGTEALQEQHDYITKALNNKKAFQPQDGCALKKIEINDNVNLLILDSQWAMMDWNKFPNLNNKCEIKSKNAFYAEVESQIVKSQDKILLIALYHPIETYGRYGNAYAFGINPQQITNKYYKEFSDRLFTLAQRFKNIVFVSGHETNLQYINDRQIPIIVSGLGKIANKSGKGPNSLFSASEIGFAKISVYTDSSVSLSFYGASNSFVVPIYQTEIIAAAVPNKDIDYNEYKTPEFVYKSIYEPDELQHSVLFNTVWGRHYRTDYITPIKLKSALLDTLYGGLTVLRKGGGHQTNSLRLQDKDGKEYSMRNAKKSAMRFIQYFLFKTQYLSPDLNDTYFIQLLQDYWTTANPYSSLTIADLSDAIALYHTNPKLYYIPKQKALGGYNEDYGDKVYFIEEQISSGIGQIASFGYHDKIIGTPDLIEKLQRKDKVTINESLYIRSRLFDNILGDFDRHSDQWRWAEEKKEDGSLLYSPIPRDRDQAYSDFDGLLLQTLTTLSPPLRFMQRYNGKYKSVQWFNDAGDDLDRMVLRNDTEEDWAREARYIRDHLTDSVVTLAFSKFPQGIDEEKKETIRNALMERISGIETHSHTMYRYIKSFIMISGTEKDDWFIITREPHGLTRVKGYRIKDGIKTTMFWDAVYDNKVTKEIWIYGLDDKDIFDVNGKDGHPVKLKIIGGKNNDTYRITDRHNIRVYDQKTKPNTFETPVHKTLTDNYDINNYNFMKGRKDVYQTLPAIGYNPDDGIAIGASFSYTKNDLVRNPFTAQHKIAALYYTATGGLSAEYTGEFAHVLGNLNLSISTGYTTPNFAVNFFGYGNATLNENESMDYNRVRIRNRWLAPSIIYRGYYGSLVKVGIKYENVKVENTSDRFISTAPVNPKVFNGQDFYGIEAGYSYSNFDSSSEPKKGLAISLSTGYKANFAEDKGFAYLIPELRITSKIDKKGILVYAAKFKAMHIFNNDFEFYQAAVLGDGEGLRGFRSERFSGKTSYYQNSDLRLSLGRIRNGVVPLSFGIYGGFDYGRVWLDGENSKKWHTSQGGGLFFNIANLTTANFAYFNSKDGGRLNIKLSLAF